MHFFPERGSPFPNQAIFSKGTSDFMLVPVKIYVDVCNVLEKTMDRGFAPPDFTIAYDFDLLPLA